MKNLYAALAKAQAMMDKAAKDSTNPHYKSKYADLASCTDAIRPAFAANGLAYIQVSHDSDKAACIETIIIHESGEQVSCGKVSVPVAKLDAHGFGAAMTYARRFSLSAAVGLATEDDDGNSAVGMRTQQSPVKQTPAVQPSLDTSQLLKDIENLPLAEAKDVARSAWKILSDDARAKAKQIIDSREPKE